MRAAGLSLGSVWPNEQSGIRVLLVAPDRGDAEFVQAMLDRHDGVSLAVFRVHSGTEALELLMDDDFDVCLYDGELGERSVLRFLRSIRAAGNSLPVVLLATPDLEELIVHCYRVGISDFLIKGALSPEMLLRSIHYATERRRIEDRHEADQRRAEKAVARSLAGVFRVSLDGIHMDCNAAFLRAFGYPSRHEAREGEALAPLLPASWGDSWNELLEELGSAEGKELWMRRRDGTLARVRVRGWVVKGTGPWPDVLEGSLIDVSDRATLTHKLSRSRRLEALGRATGGAVHDLNNILTTILGYSELLTDEIGGESNASQYAEEVHTDALRAKSLIDRLLAFGRPRERPGDQTAPVDAIDGLRGILVHQLGEQVELDLRLDDGTPQVDMTKAELEQIVLNLVLNARDAMPEGGTVKVTAALEQVVDSSGASGELAPGEYARLEVTDTGVGMDEETQRRMFDPFFTTKPEGKGRGLGLVAVSDNVQSSRGRIAVESAVGEGTTFRIWLPAAGRHTPRRSA